MEIGDRYGHWVVIEKIPRKDYVKCKCDCGTVREVFTGNLYRGSSKSCGCKGRDKSKKRWPKVQEAEKKAREVKHIDGTNLTRLDTKVAKNSTTGIKGVSYNKKLGKYRAYINLKGKQIPLGSYSTIEEAAQARKAGEEKYYKPIKEKWKEMQEDER